MSTPVNLMILHRDHFVVANSSRTPLHELGLRDFTISIHEFFGANTIIVHDDDHFVYLKCRMIQQPRALYPMYMLVEHMNKLMGFHSIPSPPGSRPERDPYQPHNEIGL